jgi:hypothetical protein
MMQQAVRYLHWFLYLSCAVAFGQGENRVTLIVDVDNVVSYRSNIIDLDELGATGTQTAPPALRPFTDALTVGDIVAVNGVPARGLWTSKVFVMGFSPTPAPRFGISDRASGSLAECRWEFLDNEGRLIGAITDGGYFPHGVTSGTGAFYGIRGQMGSPAPANAPPLPPQRPTRIASTSEDPGRRRILGGGTGRIVFTLIPEEWPTVLGAYHEDFSPISAARPARPGEVIILRASGLGPLVPGNLPSGTEPFPDPPVEVNSPVSAKVGGQSAEVINKIGWPGTTATYRVDIRVPALRPGAASLQLTAAWIPGSVFQLPVGN